MKKFKKLFLVVSIVAVLMVMMVVSVSASGYFVDDDDVYTVEDLKELDNNTQLYDIYFIVPNDCDNDVNPTSFQVLSFGVGLDSDCKSFVFTNSFKSLIVDYVLENKDSLESEFNTIIEYTAESVLNFAKNNNFLTDFQIGMGSSTSYIYQYSTIEEFRNGYDVYVVSCLPTSEYYSSYFDKLFVLEYDDYINNYALTKQLEEKNNFISTLEGQVTELNTTITEKNTVISNLESQNNKLEMNVAGLNSQVSALVEDRTELNAQIKTLESQLQLKINKAYAEGVSDGTDVQVNIIPAVITIIVLALIGLFVALIISKSNRKRTKR